MEDDLFQKEEKLKARLEKLNALEKEILQKEKIVKDKEKKQVLLRLSPSLWDELAAWAEDDIRSINGQIEYLLSESVKQRRNKKKLNDEL